MKTRIKNIILYSGIFLICGAPSISFDAIFPARKDLPGHIKTIAIIDRSLRESKLSNIIEGGLTGEGIGQDKEASRRVIEGLVAQINNSGKYQAIKTDLAIIVDQGPLEFSPKLNIAEIKGICVKYKADAVLSLEYFDTDHVSNVLNAKVGIRIYDGLSNQIIEEYSFTNSTHLEHTEHDVLNFATNFLNKDVILNLSYDCGIFYAQRISPYWLRVTRDYYKKSKGNDEFAYGARMMEVNDWDKSIEAFENALESRKRKTKGRACHNLAVIYEILGNHELALEYAQDAYGKYKNKKSKDYYYLLRRRMAEIELLEEQGN